MNPTKFSMFECARKKQTRRSCFLTSLQPFGLWTAMAALAVLLACSAPLSLHAQVRALWLRHTPVGEPSSLQWQANCDRTWDATATARNLGYWPAALNVRSRGVLPLLPAFEARRWKSLCAWSGSAPRLDTADAIFSFYKASSRADLEALAAAPSNRRRQLAEFIAAVRLMQLGIGNNLFTLSSPALWAYAQGRCTDTVRCLPLLWTKQQLMTIFQSIQEGSDSVEWTGMPPDSKRCASRQSQIWAYRQLYEGQGNG